MCRFRILLLTLALLGSSPTLRADALADRIGAILAEPIYAPAHWGLLVVDCRSGQTLYELHADKLFVPASTTKLFTVAAAWHWLGPEHRFDTALVRQGQLAPDGALQGDLILVASGDPTLGGRTDAAGKIAFADSDHTYANGNDLAVLAPADPLAGLDALARQAKAAGIRRVEGRVRVDDRAFEHATATGSGPALVTPIVVNDNLIDVVVTPTTPGQPATFDWRPRTALYEVEAKVATVAADQPTEVVLEPSGAGKLRVMGRIPAGHAPLVRVYEVEDPRRFAAGLLTQALQRAGIDVREPSADDEAPLPDRASVAALPRVATLTSPPFQEAARLILKTSHNLAASSLPLVVAAHEGKTSLIEGFHLERQFLEQAGVPIDTISLGSGAGGSRSDRITPRAAVALLRYMATRSDAAAFRDALPSLGVDGTLVTVVDPTSPARGRVQAKTGTLLAVNLVSGRFLLESKALAGYATTESGRELAFAMFVNNTHIDQPSETTREGRTLGRLCEVLVDDQ